MSPELSVTRERRLRVLQQVRQMLIRDLRVNRSVDEIEPDVGLFGTGLGLDSVDAMELVVAVESNFDVQLGDSMADPHFFRTVNAIVDVILGEAGA